MTELADKQQELPAPEEGKERAVTVDDVLDDMVRRSHRAGRDQPSFAPPSHTRVGDVVKLPDEDGTPQRVLVRWFDGEGERTERWLPVVRGLELQQGDKVLLGKPDNWPEWLVTNAIEGAAVPEEELEIEGQGADQEEELAVRVDGKRVVIEGQDEIVLRCGEASITLRRNGRIIVRGNYVETRSKGTNRIKGGSVQIN